ncbi:MAG: tetratricopeptide repeat protein, partial [Planctomycetales bacterium]|nr:tetratricopeptide repeat protein [Planctomycetales bacterium]
QWYTDKVERNEPYVLRAFVNRKRVGEWKFARGTASQVVSVPAELLVAGKQRVNFELEGRGRYSYQCVLEGFIPAAAVQDHDGVWSVTRTVEPVALEMDGKAVPRGFDLLQGSYQTFRNPLTQLPVGRRGHVELNIRRKDVRGDTRPETLEYLVVTEPIPGGTAVIENSISGGFERYELNGNTITFYIGNRPYVPTISYDVHGYLPGEYRVLPTIVRDAYRLDNYAVAKPYQLEVLPSGAQSSDDYRLTPRELFEIGKYHFERRDMQEVTRHLDELIEKWNVQPEILKQSVTMLLDARLEVGPASRVVQHFEMIKEKWPELEIPYEKILRVGRAYHEMGEYERCYLIFRATVESNFLTESRVSGFLQSQDELVRGISFMQCLLREYPPEPFIAAATFDLAQQVYALAPQARNNEKLREQKITRVDLVRKALVMLNGFLSAYPQDPGADPAAFSLVTGLLELEQFASAIEACQRAIERYPDTHELDRFWYTIGYCHFAQGNHQEALGVCQKVSEMEVKEPSTGRMVPSDERFRALYILGQIHHSLGEAAQAIARYQQVIDRFSDAREAIEYFTRQSIAVPEVTSVDPGKPPTLEIQFRNIRECELRVYRIDLMKFGLMQRDLNEITKINLAGIRPYHERSLQFGDGKDYRDRTEEVTLPLEEEGAYLVVCRGDELHASGMMLVTPLKLEIQEESSAGRVRATVRDSVADRYVPKTHVKVIGSRNDTFQSGESDLRGVFVADDIRGEATVIAQAATGQYAFYRGREFLGPRDPVAVPQHEMQQQNGQPSSGEASSVEGGYGGATDTGGKQELLEGIYGRNSIIQRDNYKRQQEQLYNDYEGVRVDAVK